MKKILLLCFLAGGVLWACDTIEGSGIHADEERNVQASYEGVRVEEGILLLFSSSLPPGRIHLSGDSDILSYVEAYVDSRGDLHLRYEPWVKIKTHIPTVATFPETVGLRRITASGGARIQAFYEIDSPSLELKASGGSEISISGWVDQANITLSGGSQLRAYDLGVADLQAHLSGGSQVEITCTYRLKVTASGGSQLYYRGSAQVEKSLSGGSQVERR